MNDTQGSIEYVARINTKNLKSDAAETESIIDGVGKKTEDSAGRGEKSFVKMGAVIGAVAGVVEQVLGRAIDGVNNLLGDAIARVDTLNNSDRTFKNMGFSVDDTRKTIEALDKSIRGLPTPLDEAIRQVTKISASINDLPKSQRVFSALNNAIIGFGGTTDDVRNSVTQLSQELGTGRITAQTWLSLTNSGLTPALAAMARQMGITTKELKEGLGEGTISADKFMDSLIELNEKGGGGMQSFEKIAKDATAGIQTGFANMKTAITRGMATIITAVGSGELSAGISKIGTGFEGALKSVAAFIPKAKEAAAEIGDYLNPKITVLFGTIRNDLLPALARLATAIGPEAIGLFTVAVGLAADSLNALLGALTPVINYLANNEFVIYGTVGALIALRAALGINAAIVAFQASLVAASGTMVATTGTAGGLRTALMLLSSPWQVTLGIVGVAAVVAGINEVSKKLDDLLEKFRKTNEASVKINGKDVGGKGSGMSIVQQIQNAFMGRAVGGPVSANTPYLVGENRDGSINDTTELFVPGRSGSIMNSKDLQAALGGSGGGTEYNIGTINISSEVDGEKWLRKLTKNQEIVSNGLVPRQAYM